MSDDNTPEYEYEYELPDPKNGRITYPSGYTSEYKPEPSYSKPKRVDPTPEELIILGAYETIKERNHKKWSDERCLEEAIKWFNKKNVAGEIKVRTKETTPTLNSLPRNKLK